jgi:GMP synthase (glutamine-hydrolysing)
VSRRYERTVGGEDGGYSLRDVVESSPVLVVQHQDDCPPALFEQWLRAAGVTLDVRRPYRGEALPDGLDGHGGLLVLGGSMNAHDDDTHAWLAPTRDLLRGAVQHGAPTLAICLGHQLAAVAYGAHSRPNPHGQTVGVLGVGWTSGADRDPIRQGIEQVPHPCVVHWNTDVVTDLPDEVEVLATTPDGAPQVVRFGARAWGVQFHPEVDHAVLTEWAEQDRRDRKGGDTAGPDLDGGLQQVKEHEEALLVTGHAVAAAFARVVQSRR